MGWWLVAARLVTLSKRENKIGVLRTSSVLGGSRMRSVLGGLVLGGDGLDGGTNELLAATMGVISLVLGCDLGDATGGTISWCWGATRPMLGAISSCCFSLSLFYFPGVEII